MPGIQPPKPILDIKDTLDRRYNSWLKHCPRGWGKSKSNVGLVAGFAMVYPKTYSIVAAPVSSDLYDVLFESDDTGFRWALDEAVIDTWDKSRNKIKLINGSIIQGRSAEVAKSFRGRNANLIYGDEMAYWRYMESYKTARSVVRAPGPNFRLWSTTPDDTEIVRALRNDRKTLRTYGSISDNIHLSSDYKEELYDLYAPGTIQFDQEILGMYREANLNAVWHQGLFMYEENKGFNEAANEYFDLKKPDCYQIVIGVDPSLSWKDTGAEAGIVVNGKTDENKYFCFEDASIQANPSVWTAKVMEVYKRYRTEFPDADVVVAYETNAGGGLNETVMKMIDPDVRVVRQTAAPGSDKRSRAEAMAMLYHHKRVWHWGPQPKLEAQMAGFTGDPKDGKLKDKVDAHVWSLKTLHEGHNPNTQYTLF